VGYRVHIPLSTFYRLAEGGGTASLHVHTHVREDAIQLFGFWSEDERTAFERLIGVSGIGPKIALAVLSGIGVADLNRAIRDEDRGVLERIPGIGRKTAERVLLELRDRPSARRRAGLEPAHGASPMSDAPSASGMDADAASALVHLGYSESAAFDAVRAARRDSGADATIETILRSALRALVR
jgi:holliday junction DNA helicase RuvA